MNGSNVRYIVLVLVYGRIREFKRRRKHEKIFLFLEPIQIERYIKHGHRLFLI